VAIIRRGRVVEQGPPEELRQRHGLPSLEEVLLALPAEE
jgi:hypothetical protein